MSTAPLLGIPGLVRKVLNYLENNGTQINNLDRLDATVSSRAPASTALNTSVWTGTKAGYVDASINGTRPVILKTQRFTSNGTWTVPTGILGRQVFLTGVGSGAGGGRGIDYHASSAGGAGMGCVSMPVTLAPGVTSVTITVGQGGAGGASDGANGGQGSSTYFGTMVRLRGAGYSSGAKHYGLSQDPEGFRNGFLISGADGGLGASGAGNAGSGYDSVDTGFTGGAGFGQSVSGGGASAFANGGENGSIDGSLGSGGSGVRDGATAGNGGDGFLDIFWYEQI
jgi:hypothetical protein